MSETGRGEIISPQTPHYASVRNNGVHVSMLWYEEQALNPRPRAPFPRR